MAEPKITRYCQWCNAPFVTYVAWIKKGAGKTCSYTCGYARRRSLTVRVAKVAKPKGRRPRSCQHQAIAIKCKICRRDYNHRYHLSRHPRPQITIIEGEEWRPVVGYEEFYSVSNMGRVRSERRGKRTYEGRLLNPSEPPNKPRQQYYRVSLYKGTAQRTTKKRVHRLVAEAFLDPNLRHLEVNHKNGNGKDNRLENLEFVTSSQNALHARRILKRGGRKRSSSVISSAS